MPQDNDPMAVNILPHIYGIDIRRENAQEGIVYLPL